MHLNYNGHLKFGTPSPPVTLEISSDVLDFNSDLALLCAALIKSSIIALSSFKILEDISKFIISPSPLSVNLTESPPEIPVTLIFFIFS